MENLKIKIAVLLLICVFSGCDKFELRGFFTSYENANERFQESNDWNNQHGYTEINISSSSYSINAFGDSHVGGTENLDTFFETSQDENVTAVVMAGDITTGHKDDYDVFEMHLPLLESLPFFATAGNHDLYFDGWQHFYSIFGSATYFFVVNTPGQSDLFICLDTGSGTLGSKQLKWFKALLESSRNNYRYCVVFTHNNLFRFRPTTSTSPMVEEIQVLLDLFLKHDVNMVVTAHDHKRNYDILGNTVHIIMDALLDENDEASYLKLSVSEEKIDYSFVDL
jgi:3',5'-cyclic AMP phosphodiesterase CpdA